MNEQIRKHSVDSNPSSTCLWFMELFSPPVVVSLMPEFPPGKVANDHAPNSRSLLKGVKMGKKWNSLGLRQCKRGDGGPNQMERVQRAMPVGPQHRFLLGSSPLATCQVRPQSQRGRAAGRLIILTPVQCWNATNKAGQGVSTWGPYSCLLV